MATEYITESNKCVRITSNEESDSIKILEQRRTAGNIEKDTSEALEVNVSLYYL